MQGAVSSIATHNQPWADADKATGVVGKGFGKAKDKVSKNKHAPADEDPTDDSAIVIHQEPDKQSNQKHRGDKVGPPPVPRAKHTDTCSAASSSAHQGSAASADLGNPSMMHDALLV